MIKLSPYRKTIVALIGAVITWVGLVIVSPEASITAGEWFVLLSTSATAVGVYQVSNRKV